MPVYTGAGAYSAYGIQTLNWGKPIEVTPGSTYTVFSRLRSVMSMKDPVFNIGLELSNGTTIWAKSAETIATTAWTEVQGDVVIPAGVTSAILKISQTEIMASFEVDEFKAGDVTLALQMVAQVTAAAGSATTASTKATEAGTSASAAASSATLANTKAGEASTSASQASTSATNAAGSATAASTSATTSATARDASQAALTANVLVGGNPGFDDGYNGWSAGLVAGAALTATHATIGVVDGRGSVLTSPAGIRRDIVQNKLHLLTPGRKYRIRSSIQVIGPAPATCYVGFSAVDAAGATVGTNSGLVYNVLGSNVTNGTGWLTYQSAPFDLAYVQAQKGATAAGIRLISMLNYNNAAGVQSALDGIWLEDITESEANALLLTTAQRALASSPTLISGRASTASLPFGTAGAGTVENFVVSPASDYVSDTDGVAMRRSMGGASVGVTLRALAPSIDGNVYRATVKFKLTAANNVRLYACLIGADGVAQVVTSGPLIAVAANTLTTLTANFGRVVGGLVTAQIATQAQWNTAASIRFGIISINSVVGESMDVYEILIDDLTNADTAFRQAALASGSASAASTSATNAAASATTAGTQATAASNSANTATTQAGTATTKATEAAASATNALGSQNAAATSATTSATALGNVQQALNKGTTLFVGDPVIANRSWAAVWGTNATFTNLPDAQYDSDADGAYVTGGLISGSTLLLRPIFPLAPGKVYRFTARVKTSAAVNLVQRLGLVPSSGAIVSGTANPPAVAVAANTMTTLTWIWGKDAGGLVTSASGSANTWNSVGLAGFRAGIACVSALTGENMKVYSLTVEDLTDADMAARQAGAASASATAAATSATNASASATTAGTQATVATTRAGEAATSAGTASTKATEAATSATDALGSKNDAATSASAAATSATNAGDSAAAASTSASSASTSATNAGISATAAATSATTATTQAGTATTKATEAATSATNAAGSATNAATSATTAATSLQNTVQVEGNPGFDNGYVGWYYGYTGAAALTSAHGAIGAYQGRGSVFVATVRRDVTQAKIWYLQPGRKYRLRSSFHLDGTGSTRMYIGMQVVDGAGAIYGVNSGLIYNAVPGTVYAANAGWIDVQSAVFDLPYIVAQKGAAAAGIRIISFLNYDVNVSATVGLEGIWFEDVTESQAAASSATAAGTSATNAGTSATAAATSATTASTQAGNASTSASSAATSATNAAGSANTAGTSATAATTSATNAGNSATAAGTSATTATTKAGEAGSSATVAENAKLAAETARAGSEAARDLSVTAKNDAQGHATSALASMSLASRLAGQGANALSGQFFETTVGWNVASAGVAPVVVANTRYTTGRQLTYDVAAGVNTYAFIASSGGGWVGPVNADAYVVEIEFMLNTGAVGGAGVMLRWRNSVSGLFDASMPLASMASGPIVAGQLMQGRAVLKRPAGFTGTFAYHELFLMSGYTSFGAIAAKNITFFRCSIRPASAEELGLGGVSAGVLDQVYTKAQVDTAIAGQTTTFTSQVTALTNRISLTDTRNDNQPPSWYWANHPRRRVDEFKLRTVIGVATGATYGNLTTIVPWSDASGGQITQVWQEGLGQEQYVRQSTSTSAWSAWVSDTRNLTDSIATITTNTYTKAQTDSAVASSITSYDASYGSGGLKSNVTSQASAIAGINDKLTAVYSLRVKAGGASAGFEMVAASNPTGAASSIRMSADEIIMNGTVKATHLIAGEVITGSAQIKNAIITNAHITDLSAAKLTAGSALAATITVSGTALSTISANAATGAANPVTRINAGTTLIDPGKILISGTTKLSDWRNGTDATTIEGGKIAANTIKANSLEIGSRNMTVTGIEFDFNAPSANRVAWTAGVISYINDAGAAVNASITANAPGTLWSSGVMFIYWVKGATTLSTTTVQATAFGVNNVILATYSGGVLLTTDYGRTIIDGGSVKANTITATQLINTAALITASAQIDSAVITDAHIIQIDASKANIGKLNARNLEVTEMLVIDAVTGALSLGKTSSFDIDNDGIFMGRTEDSPGVTGFGFVAGKEIGGIPQYLQITSQTGFKSVNARHYVSGIAAPTLVNVTTSQTITLPVGSKLLDLQLLGGGGGGGGATNSGVSFTAASNGASTTVQLWDGTTNTGIFWSSAGGLGAIANHAADNGYTGGSSALGNGGVAGVYTGAGTGVGGAGSGYGAGGGGGGGNERGGDGGKASVINSIIDYDISALANPKIVVVVGAGGAGSAGFSGAGAGGAGSPGVLKYAARATTLVPANVLPLRPTFTGTMSKANNAAVVFPNYGAGLWVLNCQGASGTNLNLGIIETHTNGSFVRLFDGCVATFISDKTPVDIAVSTLAIVYEYQFYKLSEWV